jgi:hypothetical protein
METAAHLGAPQSAIDRNHRANFLLRMADRWLALRLENIGECRAF